MKPLFRRAGVKFEFSPINSIFSFSTISVGDNVQIGSNALFIAARSEIVIGNNVIIAPGVTVRGGTHNIDEIGAYMSDVRIKDNHHDKGVQIEDDVWIGSNAIILHGVTIGRGSVIGAGSIVTRSTPPYSISVGNPAKLLRFRFNKKQILFHEQSLYPLDKRFSIEQIDQFLGNEREQ